MLVENLDPSVRQAVESFPLYRRHLWLCAAMYGKLFNHAMGTYWQINREHTDEKGFVAFVANGAFGYETTYLRDEKGIRGTRVVSSERSSSSSASEAEGGQAREEESEKITMYRPAHGVFLNRQDKEIIVAIRGTASIRDALTDLVCVPEELKEEERSLYGADIGLTHVHAGMWKAAKRLSLDLSPRVSQLLVENPDFQLVVTGHSLGAGTATLLTLLWRKEFAEKTQVTCFAFAIPQTMNEEAARATGAPRTVDSSLTGTSYPTLGTAGFEHPLITSMILGNDLVPRLSLRSALQLAENGMQLGAGQREVTSSVEVQALRPPGKIIYLRAPGHVHEENEPVVVDQAEFGEIRVARSMLIDHLWMKTMTATGASERTDFRAML